MPEAEPDALAELLALPEAVGATELLDFAVADALLEAVPDAVLDDVADGELADEPFEEGGALVEAVVLTDGAADSLTVGDDVGELSLVEPAGGAAGAGCCPAFRLNSATIKTMTNTKATPTTIARRTQYFSDGSGPTG